MTLETVDNILKDPKLQAALLSKYWSRQEAELIIAALRRSGLEPRRFAERAGIGYRRLSDRLRCLERTQPAATAAASEPPSPQAAVDNMVMAEARLPPPFVPLSVAKTPASAPPSQGRPLGLKIRFYRPTPDTVEQLVMELEVPLW